MTEQKKSFLQKAKDKINEYKSEIIFVCSTGAIIICGVVICRNVRMEDVRKVVDSFLKRNKVVNGKSHSPIIKVVEDISEVEESMPEEIRKTFFVNGFPRKLPAGQKASAVQIEKARALNIELEDGQTFVTGHPRSRVA